MPISNTTDRFNGVVASLAIKVRCVVAVEVQVDDLTGISNPYSGVDVEDLDRVLLTAQTDAIENGVWNVMADGVWERAFDWDGNRDVEKGSTVWAGQEIGEDKLWQVQTEGTILPGSTAQSITELLNPEDVSQANPIVLEELAAPLASVDDFGQIWVRDDVPNVLVFTDDTGADTVIGAGGGFQGLGIWRYRTAITSDPSNGQMQFDDLTIDNATEMYVNEQNDGGTDMTAFLDLIAADDLMYVQIQSDSSQFIVVQVDTPTKATDVYTFPIQIVEGQGAAPTQNTSVAIITSHGATAGGGGGGGVTVEDEGVPLATIADTLNFVGAGVTATGGGVTKTITIPGGGGGAVTELEDGAGNIAVIAEGGGTIGIRSTGNTDAENRDLEWQHQDGTTRFSIGQEFSTAIIIRNHITGADIIFRVGTGGGNRTRLQLTGDQSTGGIVMSAGTNPSGGHLRVFDDGVRIQNTTLFIRQQSAKESVIGGFGQIWVTDDNPQLLMFTDDDDTDFVLNGAGGGGGMVTGISKNSGANVNAANRSVLNFIEGSNVTLTIADDAGGDEVDITIAAASGAGIGGSITDNQIAVGATTADDIEGSASFLFDGSHLTVVNYEFDANQTVGAGQDNFVLTYDNATGLISLEAVPAGGAEVNDLSAAVTWVNVPNANITEASVTQHEAAIDHDALANFVAAEHLLEANIDHDALTNFLAAEHIDWAVTGAEDIHADRLPAPAAGSTFTMVTPVVISFGGDDTWETISNAALASAGATHALIKCYCQIAPTGGNFATQHIHLRETGSAIAKAASNRACQAVGEDAPTNLDASADTNDAWVELDGNQDFDILQDQTGTGTSINQAWIIGYMA